MKRGFALSGSQSVVFSIRQSKGLFLFSGWAEADQFVD